VRYRSTDYSVPTAYGHREVLIRGYVDAVSAAVILTRVADWNLTHR
jgi:hypothetical protein